MERSTLVVLAGFLGSLAILAAPLVLNQQAEDKVVVIEVAATPPAVPTRVPFDQAKSDAMQFRMLDGLFYTLVPLGKTEARSYVPVPGRFQSVVGYHNFHVGSVFHARDRHFSYDFKVKAIDSKGVVIAYSGWQGPETFDYWGNVSGQVRLGWRNRPAPTPLPPRRRP